MERRREPRFAAGQVVRLTVLNGDAKAHDRQMDVELTEVSGKGLRLRTPERLAVGSAVRIDVDDNAVLGEVCHSSGLGNAFLCGVEVDQVLSQISDLARLVDAVLGAHGPEDNQRLTAGVQRRTAR